MIVPCLFLHPTAWAQSGDLLKQGLWTVLTPAGGCGSLPLLQVKGPGTLFNSENAATLAALQQALAAPLAKACPGVHEAILANGRGRKLIKIETAESLTSSAATPAPTPAPVSSVTKPASGVALTPENDTPNVQSTAAPQTGSQLPILPTKSSLPSLASAHGIQDKCDVVLKWLETGKTATPAGGVSYGLPPQMMEIFRDESMVAIFGMPYDQADNHWRIEQYENVFSKCMGEGRRPANRSVNVRGINLGQLQRPLPREYAQEFSQYSEVIRGAFEGIAGRFEPASINRYVQGVREQITLANSEMSAGAAAPATLESFKQLKENRSRTAQQLSMLRPEEREVVDGYLNRRQNELAPSIVRSWLRDAAKDSKTPESATTLEAGHRRLNEVLGKLDGQGRASMEATYGRLIEADIAPSIEAETAKISSLQPSWEGARELGAWEFAFMNRFGDFQSSHAFRAATSQLESARARIFPSLLPAWQAKVTATPAKATDIAARRDELKAIFVTQVDRSTPLYAEFEKPINVKASELQTRIAEDERRRLVEAERAEAQRAAVDAERTAAVNGGRTGARSQTPAINGRGSSSHTGPVANGPLAVSDLRLGGGPDADILRNLYTGEFDKIELDRSSVAFSAIVSGYMTGFWQGCSGYIQDPVELTEQVCDAERTVTRGYTVVSRSCAHYGTIGTGVFAERSLYAASNSAPTQQVGSTMRTMLDAMSGRDPISGAMNVVTNVSQLKADAQNTVTANSCTSPALTRFRDNLERFALGKEGKRLDGTISMGVAMLPPSPGETYRDSNYGRLLDDMVSEQSKNWAVNRYISGSIRGVNVIARDSAGRPAKVSGFYSYNGFSNRQEGNVTLSFEEGRPICLYFSDQPSNCRTPDHRLTSNYLNGSYR